MQITKQLKSVVNDKYGILVIASIIGLIASFSVVQVEEQWNTLSTAGSVTSFSYFMLEGSTIDIWATSGSIDISVIDEGRNDYAVIKNHELVDGHFVFEVPYTSEYLLEINYHDSGTVVFSKLRVLQIAEHPSMSIFGQFVSYLGI